MELLYSTTQIETAGLDLSISHPTNDLKHISPLWQVDISDIPEHLHDALKSILLDG